LDSREGGLVPLGQRELVELERVGDPLLSRLHRLDRLAQRLELLHDLLGGLLVVPEAGRGHAGVQLVEAFLPGGQVKESPAA
jgi:hypothetical protein